MHPAEEKGGSDVVSETAAEHKKKIKLQKAVNRLKDKKCLVRPAMRYMSASEHIYADIIKNELMENGLEDKVTVITQQSLATLFEFHSENSDFPPYENTAEMSCDIVLIKNDDSIIMKILAGFEIDGPTHEEHMQHELDQYKDAVFKAASVPLIRLSLYKDRDELVKKIQDCIKEIKKIYFREKEYITRDKKPYKRDIIKAETGQLKITQADIQKEDSDESEAEDGLTEDEQLANELVGADG